MLTKSTIFSILSAGLFIQLPAQAQNSPALCEAMEVLAEKLTCFQEVTTLEQLRADYAEALQRKLSASSTATQLQAEILGNQVQLRRQQFENERVETDILIGRDELQQQSQALSQRKLARARKVSLEDLANGGPAPNTPKAAPEPVAAPKAIPPRAKPLVRRVTGIDGNLKALLEWPNGQRATVKPGAKLPDGGRISAINVTNVSIRYGDETVQIGVGERQVSATRNGVSQSRLPSPPLLQ